MAISNKATPRSQRFHCLRISVHCGTEQLLFRWRQKEATSCVLKYVTVAAGQAMGTSHRPETRKLGGMAQKMTQAMRMAAYAIFQAAGRVRHRRDASNMESIEHLLCQPTRKGKRKWKNHPARSVSW